jgi:hypothetical protein
MRTAKKVAVLAIALYVVKGIVVSAILLWAFVF